MISGLNAPVEFGAFQKRPVRVADLSSVGCDLLISAFNASDRVNEVFDGVTAADKHWVIHAEYAFPTADLPTNGVSFRPSGDEVTFWMEYLADAGLESSIDARDLVVDITGMLRPHVLSLLRVLQAKNVGTVRMLYSEPARYVKAEKTQFSLGAVNEIRQVLGFEGAHDTSTVDGDLLIIGTGYDETLIRHVAERYTRARKFQMFGLPSLQPQMYQENQLRASGASESMGAASDRYWLFAPANDPYATAEVIQEAVNREQSDPRFRNLYLAPLGTKAQVLGFGLYYLYVCSASPVSAVLPFSAGYTKESSVGLSRLWEYEFEIP